MQDLGLQDGVGFLDRIQSDYAKFWGYSYWETASPDFNEMHHWEMVLDSSNWQRRRVKRYHRDIPSPKLPLSWIAIYNISMKFDAMNRRICMNRTWPLEIGLSKYVWCQNIWTYLSNPGEKSNSTIDNVATLRTCMLTCASTIARAISARKTHRMEMVWHEVKSIYCKI